MKLIKLAAAALITLSSFTAHAGLVDVTGGSDFVIPTANQFKWNGNVIEPQYNIGGNLKSNFTGHLDIKFTYLGAEASANNVFSIGAQTLGNWISAPGDSFIHSFDLTSGDLLNFAFSTSVPVLLPSVANGGNIADISKVSFATLITKNFKNIKYDALLFLDDTGGGKDDNHDDLVIGVNIVGVPESSTFVLMMMGLVGLFAARRLKA